MELCFVTRVHVHHLPNQRQWHVNKQAVTEGNEAKQRREKEDLHYVQVEHLELVIDFNSKRHFVAHSEVRQHRVQCDVEWTHEIDRSWESLGGHFRYDEAD